MATPIPENRVELSLSEIAEATGGALRAGRANHVVGVTTDTRTDVRGKLFVALAGENFDGHAFVADAVAKGAAGVVVSRDIDVSERASVVRVQDTTAALGTLGRFHRRRWGGNLIAVGGSAGKTTTKSAIAAAVDALFPGAVHAERGNLNNPVGVPMVLFGLAREHRFAVIEIGTNTRGEVQKLAAVTEPDIAVITLIAIEHSAGIGSLDEIEAEEGELFSALGAAGTAIGNGDDERVRRQLARSPAGVRKSYGTSPGADYRVIERAMRGLHHQLLVIERPSASGEGRERVRLEVPLVGLPGALAVSAAVAVADRISENGFDPESLERALARRRVGEPGRLSVIELCDGSVVVDDTYNSNPASVLAASEAAGEIARARGARLVLVLGEMRELGALSIDEHAKLAQPLAQSGAALCVAVGGDAEHLARAARSSGLDAEFCADVEAALSRLLERIEPGDVVLIKASRGVFAERIVEGVVRAKGRRA